MAGQQAILQFLNSPGVGTPGKATMPLSNTAIQRAANRQSPTPQQKAAIGGQIANQKQQQQANLAAQRQQRFQQQASLAQQRIDISRGNLGLRGAAEQRRQGDQLLRGAELESQGLADSLKDKVSTTTQRVSDWADRMPTPGGIGVLLLAIFFLLWAVVPVNRSDGKQHTRLELLWLTLTGRTKMAQAPEGGVGGGAMGGVGGGEMNGHLPTPMQSILSSLPIRDWGPNP